MTILQPAYLDKLPPWLGTAVASAGGLGIFLIAFLDSSVLTFPVVNDLLVIQLSITYPAKMPYYALMATLGSVLGCVLLYYFAKIECSINSYSFNECSFNRISQRDNNFRIAFSFCR